MDGNKRRSFSQTRIFGIFNREGLVLLAVAEVLSGLRNSILVRHLQDRM